jgi:hypothetical protein
VHRDFLGESESWYRLWPSLGYHLSAVRQVDAKDAATMRNTHQSFPHPKEIFDRDVGWPFISRGPVRAAIFAGEYTHLGTEIDPARFAWMNGHASDRRLRQPRSYPSFPPARIVVSSFRCPQLLPRYYPQPASVFSVLRSLLRHR